MNNFQDFICMYEVLRKEENNSFSGDCEESFNICHNFKDSRKELKGLMK